MRLFLRDSGYFFRGNIHFIIKGIQLLSILTVFLMIFCILQFTSIE